MRKNTEVEAANRVPRQDRSRTTQRKILNAARTVLGEAGWEGLTIAGVAEKAGVSVGSIYQRFTDKAGLVQAVQHDVLDTVDLDLRNKFARLSARAPDTASRLLSDALDVLLEQIAKHGAVMGKMILRSASDPSLRERGNATHMLAEESFVNLFEAHAGLFDPPPSPVSARIAFRAVFGHIFWDLTFGQSNSTIIPDRVLSQEWKAVWQAYLIRNK